MNTGGSPTSTQERETAKQRILSVARALFARNGFDGNGIRDIAREAGVSVSMVSYHYGGKLGILRAIMTSFFDRYTQIVEAAVREELGVEAKITRLVAETTTFMKDRQDVFRIVVTELPHLSEDASEFEARYLQLIRNLMDEWLLPDLIDEVDGEGCFDRDDLHHIVGPALLSMVYSTFLFGRGLEKAFCFTRDDDFFENYKDLVARLIIAGVREVAGS
ncbi:MAG: TetR family transcriptional regulator [Spirochaetes bacterium]|nr:TetR family transcriptional regulator [Spirochaetota bacterium]